MSERVLIVNADDFGASAGINDGIVEAHASGIVTSTSLMVMGAAADHAVALAREHPALGIGLHLELDAQDRGATVALGDADSVRAEIALQL
ncbi:MAG TPA: ChbG/HpnK family deacetylase, partial [Solirubrobacteraceae bacterium]|nr:ChbG/HpnK family deacetylase [Solirubrobacteraceae bacterium]